VTVASRVPPEVPRADRHAMAQLVYNSLPCTRSLVMGGAVLDREDRDLMYHSALRDQPYTPVLVDVLPLACQLRSRVILPCLFEHLPCKITRGLHDQDDAAV
jgi:hypothetical protein